MKKPILAFAAAVMALSATAASAQPYRDSDRDGIPNYRDPNPYNARNPGLRDRDHDGVPNAYDRYDNRRHHRWARGERLDTRYHSRTYVVGDWRRHGWRAPPPGYAYYRTDTGDVVLAAVATGVIASVIANALTQ
jgi:Ni/Co efflux regulator RcnB